MTQAVVPPAARSVIAGKRAHGSSVVEGQGKLGRFQGLQCEPRQLWLGVWRAFQSLAH
jgi:hypothetical protein